MPSILDAETSLEAREASVTKGAILERVRRAPARDKLYRHWSQALTFICYSVPIHALVDSPGRQIITIEHGVFQKVTLPDSWLPVSLAQPVFFRRQPICRVFKLSTDGTPLVHRLRVVVLAAIGLEKSSDRKQT